MVLISIWPYWLLSARSLIYFLCYHCHRKFVTFLISSSYVFHFSFFMFCLVSPDFVLPVVFLFYTSWLVFFSFLFRSKWRKEKGIDFFFRDVQTSVQLFISFIFIGLTKTLLIGAIFFLFISAVVQRRIIFTTKPIVLLTCWHVSNSIFPNLRNSKEAARTENQIERPAKDTEHDDSIHLLLIESNL